MVVVVVIDVVCVKKKLGQEIFWLKKSMSKNFRLKKIFGQNKVMLSFGQKNCCIKN